METVISIELIIIIVCCFIILYNNYHKIPSKIHHINRNKYNIFPVGHLRHIKDNQYIDNNEIIWIKRNFFASLFHNPFINYVFETYDSNKISSSEVQILKTDFDSDNQHFQPASYNFYSSFNYPFSHIFADIIPIFIYLGHDYILYNN